MKLSGSGCRWAGTAARIVSERPDRCSAAARAGRELRRRPRPPRTRGRSAGGGDTALSPPTTDVGRVRRPRPPRRACDPARPRRPCPCARSGPVRSTQPRARQREHLHAVDRLRRRLRGSRAPASSPISFGKNSSQRPRRPASAVCRTNIGSGLPPFGNSCFLGGTPSRPATLPSSPPPRRP